MPRIAYINKRFNRSSLEIIAQANTICADYRAQGFDLTLRQLYYQFVARGLIPNKDTEYKRLGSVINDARLAGRLDWTYITDRTRNVRSVGHFTSPPDVMRAAHNSYRLDKWEDQDERLEVWIEKDALVGVIQAVCERNDVAYFSCRGYTSQSEVWGAAQRMLRYIDKGQHLTVIHLGDHDPSGLDMTRDVIERLRLFIGYDADVSDVEIRRVALNMDQVEQYNPPPNPAKTTDARFLNYEIEYGTESWELDALSPAVIADVIEIEILRHRDEDAWDAAVAQEERERDLIEKVAQKWSEIVPILEAP
jgi:hypothetical protein